MPAFALAYGAVFLDEAVTATALAGLALVLGGTALATGRGFGDVASVAAWTSLPGGRRSTTCRFSRRSPRMPTWSPSSRVSRASTPEAIAERVARSQREPDGFGVLVIEADGEPVGTMSWELVNRRSRIAAVSGFAVDPGLRERGVGIAAAKALQRHLFTELGFHRLQMEVYGFNERGLRHAERVGWVREGVRRRAYWRDEAWVDGVLFGLLADELDDR